MRARGVRAALNGVGLAAGTLVTIVVVVVASGRWGGAGIATEAPPAVDRAAERHAIDDYNEALQPLLRDGGQVVADGMRPGVADIADGAFDDEVLVRMASGWVAAMSDVAADVAALPTPPALDDVAVRFERALRTYVRAAESLLAAARTGGAERADLVERAAELGRAADRLFDDAEATLDRHRNELADVADERGTR